MSERLISIAIGATGALLIAAMLGALTLFALRAADRRGTQTGIARARFETRKRRALARD